MSFKTLNPGQQNLSILDDATEYSAQGSFKLENKLECSVGSIKREMKGIQ